MKRWVHRKIGGLLDVISGNINRAALTPEEEEIHDLRVSIRRTRECLRVFEEFFPQPEVKRVRSAMGGLMRTAAEIRNRDIALRLLEDSGAHGARLRTALERQRLSWQQHMRQQLERAHAGDAARQWKASLGIHQ